MLRANPPQTQICAAVAFEWKLNKNQLGVLFSPVQIMPQLVVFVACISLDNYSHGLLPGGIFPLSQHFLAGAKILDRHSYKKLY